MKVIDLKPPKDSNLPIEEYIIEHVATTGLTGITGAGKTSLLTDYCLAFKEYGENPVYAPPGYDVYYDKDHTKTLTTRCTLLQIAKWAADEDKRQKLNKSLLAIDQIENHLQNQWNAFLPDFFKSVVDQRRKLVMGIVFTLQKWNELIPGIRGRTFYLFELKDWHFGNPDYPRGQTVSLIMTDNLGYKTGIEGSQYIYPMTFHPPTTYEYYNTNQWTDPTEKMRKTKVIGEPNIVDLDNLNGEKIHIAADKLADEARSGLIHAFEAKKNKLKGLAYWNAAHLDYRNSLHQKIAAQLNEELGIEKTTNGVYKRDYALINS